GAEVYRSLATADTGRRPRAAGCLASRAKGLPLNAWPELPVHRDVAQARDDDRLRAVALHVRLHNDVVPSVEEQDPWRILNDQAFSFLVELVTHLRVGLVAGVFDQRVHLGVGVVRVVLAAGGVEQEVDDVLRVRVVHDPADAEHLHAAAVEVVAEARRLRLLDGVVNAEGLAPPLADRRARATGPGA